MNEYLDEEECPDQPNIERKEIIKLVGFLKKILKTDNKYRNAIKIMLEKPLDIPAYKQIRKRFPSLRQLFFPKHLIINTGNIHGIKGRDIPDIREKLKPIIKIESIAEERKQIKRSRTMGDLPETGMYLSHSSKVFAAFYITYADLHKLPEFIQTDYFKQNIGKLNRILYEWYQLEWYDDLENNDPIQPIHFKPVKTDVFYDPHITYESNKDLLTLFLKDDEIFKELRHHLLNIFKRHSGTSSAGHAYLQLMQADALHKYLQQFKEYSELKEQKKPFDKKGIEENLNTLGSQISVLLALEKDLILTRYKNKQQSLNKHLHSHSTEDVSKK